MLRKTFGDRWANHDKEQPAASISPEELAAYIQAHPEVLAVSSHHAVLPVPTIPQVEVIPVMFLRHPLDRVRSVYDFERRQGLETGPVSKGAEHAARLSFADYLRWRLDATQNGVVHNFQTVRLIYDRRYHRHALKDADFDRAWARVQALPFFGLVEQFDASIGLMNDLLQRRGIPLATNYVARNQSKREGTLEERLDRMRHALGEPLWQELQDRNRRDLQLYERAEREFAARLQVA